MKAERTDHNPANRSLKDKSGLAAFLGSAFVGGAAVLVVWKVIGIPPAPANLGGLAKLSLVVGVIVTLHLVLAAHEAGHLIGGKLVGWRATRYVVGPIDLLRMPTGWSLRANRNIGLWGGLAVSLPRDAARLRQRMRVMVAGGPSTSIMLGAIALIASALVRNSGTGAIPFVTAFLLLVFGFASVLIGGITLIPGKTGGYLTDGSQLWRLRNDAPGLEGELATSIVVAHSLTGVRPRDWNAALVDLMLTAQGEGAIASAYIAHLHALDRGDTAAAARHLAAALGGIDNVNSQLRNAVLIQGAFFRALWERDLDGAKARMAAAQPSATGTSAEREMARAAILFLEGDRNAAQTAITAARQRLATSADLGSASAQHEWLDELERRS